MNTVVPRAKLAAILGMIGSAHDGEALNAARLADRLVRDHGLTWHDALTPPLMEQNQRQRPDGRDFNPVAPDWSRTAAECSRYLHLLNRWEADFLAGLARFPRLSFEQRDVLRKIVVRLRACGCGV
jgi:hypothetical protein